MRRMKDSGIEWIGLIPESWEINKLRNCASFIQDKYDNNMGNLSYIGLENIVSWNGKYIETESVYDKTQTLLFVKDDILWGKLRPYLAKVYHAKDVGCCSSEFCVIRRRPDLLDKRYFWNLLISSEFVSAVNRSTYGTKMPRANPDYIKNIMIPTPTIEEQQRIANFLDAECAQIDAIIEQTRATVEEYKKLKQSIITQAVTKGIRPNRPMKDSGIEWIGEIPDDWEIRPIKGVSERIIVGLATSITQYYQSDGVPLLRNLNIKEDYLADDDILFLDREWASLQKGKMIMKGDILTVRTGYIGISCIAPNEYDGALSFTTLITTPDLTKINARFLMWYINISRFYSSIFFNVETGAQNNLNTKAFVNLEISVPPLEEQKTIVAFIDKESARIDGIVRSKLDLIKELENYKKSLIYEYVTGKKEAC